MRFLFTLAVLQAFIITLNSQVIFQEDFESGVIPADWTQQTNASDNGWKVGSFVDLSSPFWPIAVNGSIYIAATNDDACNCDKSDEYFITPPLDFTGLQSIALGVDIFFGRSTYEGFTEEASIRVSLDKVNWTVVEQLHGHSHGEWDTHKIDLSEYAGEDSVYIAFYYHDDNGWMYGIAIDNVIVEKPVTLDADLYGLKYLPFGVENQMIEIKGNIYNNGITPITSVEVNYSINGGSAQSALFDNLNLEPFQYFEFAHPAIWNPTTKGIYDIAVEITSVNGTTDEDTSNDTLSFQTEIFGDIVAPNRIDEFLESEPIYNVVATQGDGLDKPTDLDFFPILEKNELWIINERTENIGGNTMTIYDAGTPEQTYLNRTDGNSWHFMSLPTAIAFSDNFNFATSTGVKDANHNNGTFTGPTLWSSDPEIYAQPSGGNGSHLDMLHGSPYSMGIASETENIFWVFDGWDETIVRYDFKSDHGPGNDDHSDGVLRRYSEIEVKKDAFVPSHLVLDHATNWLYVVDNGNDRVLRLDVTSGQVVGALPLINEPLAEHSQMGNVTWEVIISDGLVRPSGIEIVENRLLVSDYTTGDIIIYDTENNFAELGRIQTGQEGITGIKVGPDGALWYTNRLLNTVTKVEPGEVTSTNEESLLAQIRVTPNPTPGLVYISLPNQQSTEGLQLELTDITGKKIFNKRMYSHQQEIDLSGFPEGLYMLSISNDSFAVTEKIVLNR